MFKAIYIAILTCLKTLKQSHSNLRRSSYKAAQQCS